MKNHAIKVAVGLSFLAGATILGGMLAEPVIAQVRAFLREGKFARSTPDPGNQTARE